MSAKNNNKNKSILSLFSGQKQVLTTPKIYVQLMGSHTAGIFLNQCIFFSGITTRPDGEFYKTYEDWEEECCLTKRQVLYSANKLKKMGVLITKIKKAKGSPTVHYTIDSKKVINLIYAFLANNSDDNKMPQEKEKDTENTCIKDNLVLQNVIIDSDKMLLSKVTKCNYPYTEDLAVELIQNTTTTEIIDSPDTKEVVVVNSKITKELTTAFENNSEQSGEYENLDEFLDACAYAIINRGKNPVGDPYTIPERIRGLIKLIRQGLFDKPKGWKNKSIQPVKIEVEIKLTPEQELEQRKRGSENLKKLKKS